MIRPAVFGSALCVLALTAQAARGPIAREQSGAIGTSEARGLWTHVTQMISPDPEQGHKDIEAIVNRMARARLNLLLPWVRSEYVGALMDPEFPRDNAFARLAEWDALGELIAAAHKREIETHLWYSFTHYKSRLSHEMRQHPEWAARRLDEIVPGHETGKVHPPRMTDVCNMHPGARQLELEMLTFLLDRYPLATGVHIEEPGFGYAGNCFCNLCNQTFKLAYEFDQQDRPDGPEATDLKCLATTDFMRRLRTMMLQRNPELILSANGGYRWQTERIKGRDWGHWSRLGWIDYYVPQIYVTDTKMLTNRASETIAALRGTSQAYVGFSVSPPSIRPEKLRPEAVCKVVETIRATGATGIVFFWAGAFTDEHVEALGKGPFAQPARVPAPSRVITRRQSALGDHLIEVCKTAEQPDTWRFKLDPRNEGDTQGYQQASFDDSAWKPIRVACTWESQGYDYDGHAWYRTSFDLLKAPAGALHMHFGGVDGPCWVFLNGRLVGEHARWDEPFDVDLSKAARQGRNMLAVHVYDGSGQGGIYQKVVLYEMPANLIGNGGFDDGLDGWRPSEHASLASPEHGPCLKLAGTGQDDSKAGCEVKLDEPMTGSVRLTFRGKRLGREPAGLVGITGRFDFTDGTWEWFNEPWRLLPAEAGRWVRKQGIYIAEKPVKSIGVWCINYRSGESTLIDDAYLAVFAERKERP